jgi:RNA polymerase sigma factor (sigma-70 family)
MSAVSEDDELLVARSLVGNRSAFETIVMRYQSLVCSVAYSAVGNVHRSEDVAQETFLTAWRQLRELREPGRLAAWLCGIARNLARSAYHHDLREPVSGGVSIDEVVSLPGEAGKTLLDGAIRDEEHEILWRSIATLPPSYREVLVLFYREQHSIDQVARALDLSEDAVRQRLSRGRKLLHGEVMSLVERTLERSGPGKAFTLLVMGALPAAGMIPATSAAATGLGAIHGSMAAKSGLAALMLGIICPVIGAVSIWFGVRAGVDAVPTPIEKKLVIRHVVELVGGALLFSLALCLLVFQGPRFESHGGILFTSGALLGIMYSAWLVTTLLRTMRDTEALRAEMAGPSHCREFRSTSTLLGWPLYHVRYGTPPPGSPFVRGWIAVGDRSIGLLFAMGQIAIAPVSLGVVAVGGLTVGGVAIGLLPMASVALGVMPLGGTAFGLLAIGGFAAGWFGAVGGLALSITHAAGGFAIAPHANDAVATAWLSTWIPPWLVPALVVVIAVVAIVPPAVFASRQRRHLRSP